MKVSLMNRNRMESSLVELPSMSSKCYDFSQKIYYLPYGNKFLELQDLIKDDNPMIFRKMTRSMLFIDLSMNTSFIESHACKTNRNVAARWRGR